MLDTLTKRLGAVLSGLRGKGRLTENDVQEMLREVRVALLEADVNFAVAKQFIAGIKEKAVGEEVFGSLSADETIVRIVRNELIDLLGKEPVKFKWAPEPPTIILMCGLQGSGKTTTCAKLARHLMKDGKKVMMAACDLQRPAAIRQLEVLGEQVGATVYAEVSANPVQVARKAVERARYLMLDAVIIDTAGRLQVDEALMDELGQVFKATTPQEVFLVVDATTGQEAVNVAKAFQDRVPLTGAIFTKLDGDTRGGAVLSVRQATGVPVRFTGVGEQIEALEPFFPERMAGRILGMGDVLGIIEAAEQAIDRDEAKSLEKKIKGGGDVDFEDMLQQFKALRKMGPIKNILKMIPGAQNMLPEGALDQMNDAHVNRIEAMIFSMTPYERRNPDIINGSRRKRIAGGSGTSVEEVNALLRQLFEMRKSMRQLGKMQDRMNKFSKRRRK